MTTIGKKCFYDGSYWERQYRRIVLPDTIQTIEKWAFCEVVCEELVVPDSVAHLEPYAFCDLTVKKDFYYPSACTEIPTGALNGVVVTEGVLVIPETVTKIGRGAISASRSRVRLLCDPSELEAGAFRGLSYDKLEIGGKQGFVLEDGMLLNKDRTELIKCLKATSTDIVVPDTVKRVHAYAFNRVDTTTLKQEREEEKLVFQVYLPEGITELEEGTFSSCDWLDTLFLPASLEKIADGVFTEDGIGVIHILVFQSAKVPEIGKNNEVDEVRIEGEGASLAAFQIGLEGKLKYKKISGGSAQSGEQEKNGAVDHAKIEENIPTKEKSQSDQPGRATLLQEHILYTLFQDGTAEVTQVGADAREAFGLVYYDEKDYFGHIHDGYDYNLGDVTIPKQVESDGKSYIVTSIGKEAFMGSFQYGKIVLPDTVTSIGDYAFCQRIIKELVLPDSITEMGIGVFEETAIDGELVFPTSMSYVPYRTFYKTLAARLVIPNSVVRMDRYALMMNKYVGDSLDLWMAEREEQKMEVILSKNLKEAGECAFYASPKYCTVKLTGKGANVIEDGMLFNKKKTELIMALEPVTGDYHIPKTVRRIHAYAFSAVSQGVDSKNGATGRIWVPEGVKVLEKGTFRNCFCLKSLNLPFTMERIEAGAWSCISLDEPNAGKGLQNLVIKAKKPPEIVGKQKTLRKINVPNESISKYEKALTGKIGYKKLY